MIPKEILVLAKKKKKKVTHVQVTRVEESDELPHNLCRDVSAKNQL